MVSELHVVMLAVGLLGLCLGWASAALLFVTRVQRSHRENQDLTQVFWMTANGECLHADPECASLKNARPKKKRLCQRCIKHATKSN